MKNNFKIILYTSIILFVITSIGCVSYRLQSKTMTERAISTDKLEVEDKNITIEIENDKEGDTNQAVEPVSLGYFKLTAYCSCSLCCGKWANNRPIDKNGNTIVYGSIGERLMEGYSIAVDPSVIPYGAKVIIDGRTYKAQDCGGAIKGKRIDVYFENHQDALNYGVQYAEVFAM